MSKGSSNKRKSSRSNKQRSTPQIDMLRGMNSQYCKQVDVLTSLNKMATGQLPQAAMKEALVIGQDLKKGVKQATKGDSSGLMKFIQKNANPNK